MAAGERQGGHVRLVRYADDYLLLFEDRADALRMLADLPSRLAKFGLSLHEGKTRLVEFGRFAAANRDRRGEERPETFDFLGFTHFCGVTRKGGFMVQRKTQRTRMIRKLKELRAGDEEAQARPGRGAEPLAGTVLRGHYAYFGITGNSASITKFHLGRRAMVALGAAAEGAAPQASLGAVQCDPEPLSAAAATARAQLALQMGAMGNPMEEPGAGKSHAGICEGGDGRPSPLLDQSRTALVGEVCFCCAFWAGAGCQP